MVTFPVVYISSVFMEVTGMLFKLLTYYRTFLYGFSHFRNFVFFLLLVGISHQVFIVTPPLLYLKSLVMMYLLPLMLFSSLSILTFWLLFRLPFRRYFPRGTFLFRPILLFFERALGEHSIEIVTHVNETPYPGPIGHPTPPPPTARVDKPAVF